MTPSFVAEERGLAAARRALRTGAHGPFLSALERTERLYRDEIAGTAEGVAAFLGKRVPRWERG